MIHRGSTLLLTLFLSTTAVSAQAEPELPPPDALDLDEDGRISRAELDAALEERARAGFSELDSDGDGSLSPAEHQVAYDRAKARRDKLPFWARRRLPEPATFSSIDRDESGALTVEELLQSAAPRRERLFKRADRNGDGFLSRKEVEEIREKLKKLGA